MTILDSRHRARSTAAPRRPGRRAAAASLPALAVAAVAVAWWSGSSPPAAPTSIDLTAALQRADAARGSRVDSVEIEIRQRDTLDRIFRSVGLDLDALAEIRSLPEVRRALDVLRPGDVITLTHVNGMLETLNRRISDTLTLTIARQDGRYAASFVENPLETEVLARRARISTTLFQAGRDAGMSAEVVMTLAGKMFGWDIDFALDIREGDEFGVVFERRTQDGRFVEDGRVLAAEFVNRGRTHRALWFESADGEYRGYYTPEGRSVRQAFLRAPLDFLRVSSSFNPRRRHPITQQVRAHRGIDYAAPTGTPIWAAGDGRVEFAGRKAGYGNTVVIDHGRGVTTLYAHMSRIGGAIRPGRRLRQGEVIGLVGATGATTGPHLHYEYRVNGQHRDPATVTLLKAQLPDAYLAEFRRRSAPLLARLDGARAAEDDVVRVARR